jgi:hypothetical protein
MNTNDVVSNLRMNALSLLPAAAVPPAYGRLDYPVPCVMVLLAKSILPLVRILPQLMLFNQCRMRWRGESRG